MATIDFPNTPTIGDQFVAPGGQTYQWNGTAWLVSGTGNFVAKIGDTMTGPLLVPRVELDPTYFLEVSGAVNPVINLDATDYISYDRTNDQLNVVIGGQGVLAITGIGTASFVGTGALRVPAGTTAQQPATPPAGSLRFNTTVGRFEGYNGTVWSTLTTSSVTAGVTIGNTPPPAPHTGDLWWENDSGILFIYYSDGTSGQWVSASPAGVSLAAIAALEARIAALEAA